MGIGYFQAQFLLDAEQNGVQFTHTATLGRLTAYLTDQDLATLRKTYQKTDELQLAFGHSYSDTFFQKFLQVQDLTAIDFSDYEGARLIHDMNQPIDLSYHGQFDVVIDSGSLEHIFNFPVAITNCMNLVKTGGSLFITTMANNHCGHGFYQFSPELMFRIFQPENGFAIEKVVLELHAYPGGELTNNHNLYLVRDPAEVGMRVGLVSSCPVMMMVHARKLQHLQPFARPPLQSDYKVLWKSDGSENQPGRPPHTLGRRIRSKIFRLLPIQVRNYINGQRQLRLYSIKNRAFYQKIKR